MKGKKIKVVKKKIVKKSIEDVIDTMAVTKVVKKPFNLWTFLGIKKVE
jgi:hypothetical protein